MLIKVAACGVCHTDLGFYYDGVPTRHPFPLILGHEISGTVVEAGDGAEDWVGKQVVVPAVIPCGECDACILRLNGFQEAGLSEAPNRSQHNNCSKDTHLALS